MAERSVFLVCKSFYMSHSLKFDLLMMLEEFCQNLALTFPWNER